MDWQHRLDRRGFTLMEVIVVLGIVLALASVIAPVVITWRQASRLESAGSQVEAALIMARADAQRQSAPVRVMARMNGSGEVELVAEAVSLDDRRGRADAGGLFDGGEREGDGGSLNPKSASGEPAPTTVSCTLPRGVVVRDALPDETLPSAADGAGPGDGERRAGAGVASGASGSLGSSERVADRSEWVLLALFLPDGEVVRPGPRYLIDSRGKAAEVRVDSWSGRVSVKQIGRSAKPEGTEPSAVAPGPAGPAEDSR